MRSRRDRITVTFPTSNLLIATKIFTLEQLYVRFYLAIWALKSLCGTLTFNKANSFCYFQRLFWE